MQFRVGPGFGHSVQGGNDHLFVVGSGGQEQENFGVLFLVLLCLREDTTLDLSCQFLGFLRVYFAQGGGS